MLLSRSATLLVTAIFMFLVSVHARAQGTPRGGTSTFPEPPKTMEISRQAMKPHIGITGGLLNPETAFETSMEYGIDIGFQPWMPFGASLEITGLSTDRTEEPQPRDLNRTNILLKGTYNLGGTIPVVRYSYLGLGLGAVVDASAYKGVHSGIAPLAGFDIPLSEATAKYFSLGLGTKYLFVSGPAPDSFSVNGQVKYWF